MSAVVESTERAPGLPVAPPNSTEARCYADAVLVGWSDDQVISLGTVRKLLADTYDIGLTIGGMEALRRVRP